MILYVNGDSNSAGNGKFWTDRLCDAFKPKHCINHALGGGSNPRILRTVRDYLNQAQNLTNDLFMVIGWTSWEREEWAWRGGHYFQVNASGNSHVPESLRRRYKEWVADSDAISQVNKSRTLHKEILDLHVILKDMKIKHLFFNALMPFQHEVLWQPELRADWNNSFIGPYDNNSSYYWYLKNLGFEPDANNHHGQAAQEAWADFLIRYIQTTGVLD